MIAKISTNIIKGLFRQIKLKAPNNLELANFTVPLRYIPNAMFSTNTPKLKPPTQDLTPEDNILIEENAQLAAIDFQSALTEYPFIHIPIYVIRNPARLKASETLKKQIIAFKALTAVQKDLPLAKSILLSQSNNDLQVLSGQQIFDLFYSSKLLSYVKILNEGSRTLQERLHIMNILINTSKRTLDSSQIKDLDQRNIVKQDETGALAAYYTHFLIKNQRDYTHLIDLVTKKLEQVNNPNRLYIAGTVISTPRFMESYPQRLIDLALQTFTLNIPKMHNFKILVTLRQLYKYQSQSSRKYSEALKNHLMRVHLNEGSIDFHVPLILKTIKYCSKQRVNCNELVQFITRNMQRFKIIFTSKNLSKGVLFSLIFQKTNPKFISQQMKGYLKDYFLKGVNELTQAEQVEQNELIRFSKLFLQFSEQLTDSQKVPIREAYLKHIIPNFNHSNEVLFYSILLVLRDKLPNQSGSPEQKVQYEKELQKIKKYIIQYLLSCATTDNKQLVISRNINSAIQIYYQIDRHEIEFRKGELPSLLKYDFSAKDTVQSQTISLFLRYLNNAKEPKQLVHSVLDKIEPQIELFFKKKKIRSIQTVYCLLNVCDKVDFEHKYLYKHVENFFGNFVSQHPNFFIPEKDIKFINQKMLKRGYGSSNLKQFISGVMENPKNWPRLRTEYTQKEMAFKQRIYSKSRENSQTDNSPQKNRYPKRRQ